MTERVSSNSGRRVLKLRAVCLTRPEYTLRYYGHNNDIDITDGGNAFKQAESRERILKKYIWAMAYHNRFCERTNKLDFFINTVCNCDTRFLRTVVDVKDCIG